MQIKHICAIFACLALAGGLYAGNIVVNGSFETGDFTGWTGGGNYEDTDVYSGPFESYSGAEDGIDYAILGPVGSDGSLGQVLSDTPGASYTVSFWLASQGDSLADFSAYWGGTQLLSLSDPNSGGVWNEYSYLVTGTGSDALAFNFRDDPYYIAFDNVSVSPAGGGIPEPASVTLLAGGLIAFAFRLRRR